ncbi:MAG: bactofilin family protein [Brevinematia bacterium]
MAEVSNQNALVDEKSSSQGDLLSNSVIGIKNSFSGEFRADGLLRIDGDFKGTIRSSGTVLVGEKGRIVGDIYARYARIGGKVKGSVYCTERVDILSTGKIIGNLWTRKIKAEEGMVFTGEAKILDKKDIDEIFHQNVINAPSMSKEFEF